jgi:hypothetical protein
VLSRRDDDVDRGTPAREIPARGDMPFVAEVTRLASRNLGWFAVPWIAGDPTRTSARALRDRAAMSWDHDLSRESTPALERPYDPGAHDRRSVVVRLQDAMRARRLPSSWLALSAYLGSGVFLGLLLIAGLALTGRDKASAASLASVTRHETAPAPTTSLELDDAPSTSVTDNVVRLTKRDIGESCWRGMHATSTRVNVTFDVGVDGRVRSATATGGSPTMRACVEAHVKRWELLPQAQPQKMILPFEVARR